MEGSHLCRMVDLISTCCLLFLPYPHLQSQHTSPRTSYASHCITHFRTLSKDTTVKMPPQTDSIVAYILLTAWNLLFLTPNSLKSL
jgi:hypothetical protein